MHRGWGLADAGTPGWAPRLGAPHPAAPPPASAVSATLCRAWGGAAVVAADAAAASDVPSALTTATTTPASSWPPRRTASPSLIGHHHRRRRRRSTTTTASTTSTTASAAATTAKSTTSAAAASVRDQPFPSRIPGGDTGAPSAAAAVNAALASAAAAVEGVEDGLRSALRRSVSAGERSRAAAAVGEVLASLHPKGRASAGGGGVPGVVGGGGLWGSSAAVGGGGGAGGALRAFFEGDRPLRGGGGRRLSRRATPSSASWTPSVAAAATAGVRLDDFAAALWAAAAAAGGGGGAGGGGSAWAAAAWDSARSSLAVGACGASSSSLGSVGGWCASTSASSSSVRAVGSSGSSPGVGQWAGVPIRAGGSSAELAFGVGVGLPVQLNSALSAQTCSWAASMRPFVAALAAAILDAGRREAAAAAAGGGGPLGGQTSSAFLGSTAGSSGTSGGTTPGAGSAMPLFWPPPVPVGEGAEDAAPFLVRRDSANGVGGGGGMQPVAVLPSSAGDGGPDGTPHAGVHSTPPSSTARPAQPARRRQGVRTGAVPVVTPAAAADYRTPRSWTATEVVPSGGGLSGLSMLGFERSLGAAGGRGATPDMRQIFAAALAFSMYVVTRRPTVATLRRHQRRARSRQTAAASPSEVVAAPVPGTEVEGARTGDVPPGAVATDGGEGFVAGLSLDASLTSDLRLGPRDITIVTTAGLPWMTGTAVNPLLRAVYLAREGHRVSLVIPWLPNAEDQARVFPKGVFFETQDEQAEFIYSWVRRELGPEIAGGVVGAAAGAPGAATPAAPSLVNGATLGAVESAPSAADAAVDAPSADERLFTVRFYESVYSVDFGSILPLGDITTIFGPDDVKDVCVLEEPEHLTWHHAGRMWTSVFRFVVGVVHTNYIEYARMNGFFGPSRALFLGFLNKWVCRSYCHRVIKLSDAVQPLPHSVTCNVHGVRDKFLQIGRTVAAASAAHAAALARTASLGCMSTAAESEGWEGSSNGDEGDSAVTGPRPPVVAATASTVAGGSVGATEVSATEAGADVDVPPAFPLGAYFLGKVLWTKGYLPLVELLEEDYVRTGDQVKVDFFGSGPDLDAVKARVTGSTALAGVTVHGKVIDHAAPALHGYKLYVNPSNSDVVCTATAEALAMGKFVICLEHPSNDFFSTFTNCFTYRTAEEFSDLLRHCLARQPAPLSADEQYRLSWEAATQRFYTAALVPPEKATQSRVDSALAVTHKTICSNLVTPPADAWVRPRDPPASPTTPGSLSPQVSPLGSPLDSPRVSPRASPRSGPGGMASPGTLAGPPPAVSSGGGPTGTPSPRLSPLLSPSTTEALRRSRNQLRRRANGLLAKPRGGGGGATPARAPAWPLRFGGSPLPPAGGPWGVTPKATAPPPAASSSASPAAAVPSPSRGAGGGGAAGRPRTARSLPTGVKSEPLSPLTPERGGGGVDVPPPPSY